MLAYVKRTTVMIPDEVDAKLRHLAQVRGTTVSELTREALEQYVGPRRLRAAGAGDSGRSDVSARIEEILTRELGADPRR